MEKATSNPTQRILFFYEYLSHRIHLQFSIETPQYHELFDKKLFCPTVNVLVFNEKWIRL